ncbi:MAG: ADP-ribosylglycohydrolase family protein [Desulfobacterales bacterium]|nr:MAG: ADP-ribosylglycohydrolase family protein [Desulfobacterales bacterium]
MIGAIVGDIIGSVFEQYPIKTTSFPLFSMLSRFTDDTVLTIAIADSILHNFDYATALKAFARRYPAAGYGLSFYRWMQSSNDEAYYSWGNGSAMRVSPVGFAFNSIEKVLNEAEKSAAVTHNHPEGIKGAQATALAIYLARQGTSKAEIGQEITDRFGYNLNRSLNEIRPSYIFDVSCQGSVPESMIAFFESHNFEDAIRMAISLGGDTDTMGCIAGGIAQAFYRDISPTILIQAKQRLPQEFLAIIEEFNNKYGIEL